MTLLASPMAVITPDDLLKLPDAANYELVDGEDVLPRFSSPVDSFFE